MTDFVDQKRDEMAKRLTELKPLIDEYHRLEAAVSALDGVSGAAPAASAAAAPRRGPGRPRGGGRRAAAATTEAAAPAAPKAPRGAPRKAGRRKGSGTRAAQALALVTEQPGITIPELAARMGIKQNYLYRVLPTLEEEGKVAKEGRGWHPKS